MPLIFIWMLLEIAAFIVVGEWLGVWRTLFIVVISTVLGFAILRGQSLALMKKMQEAMRTGRAPTSIKQEVPFIMLAGLLLIIPGLLSDVLAVLVLIWNIPKLIMNGFKKSKNDRFSTDNIIEGEFWEETNKKKQLNKPKDDQ